jgi:hypothetical protein
VPLSRPPRPPAPARSASAPALVIRRRALLPGPLPAGAPASLLVQWYRSANTDRQAEIDFCLARNATSAGFERVEVFVPAQDLEAAREQAWASSRCVRVHSLGDGGRLLYADALRLAVDPGRVYVLANSDIVVPARAREQIVRRVSGGGRPVSLCLTRWESSLDDCRARRLVKHARSCQDLWAFRGGAAIAGLAAVTGFPLGVPACDHKIAWALSRASRVINPCRSIVTLHIHGSRHRTYGRADRLAPPYLYVEPSD